MRLLQSHVIRHPRKKERIRVHLRSVRGLRCEVGRGSEPGIEGRKQFEIGHSCWFLKFFYINIALERKSSFYGSKLK
ncbi:unnamed protein product [Sympodiomycopsis kandeliae]